MNRHSGVVHGERREPAVHRERSLQSRLTGLLAGGLIVALALGALSWYYTGVLTRQARAREAARAASAAHAQGEMPLPPLRQVFLNPPDTPDPPPAPPPPVPEPAPVTPAPMPAVKSAAQLAGQRRLSGAVFARESGRTPDPPVADPLAPTPGTDAPAAGQGASPLAALLRPTITPAVEARMLPTQRFLLPRGAFIDCTLETAIDSSLAGMTSCVTAADTFGADGKVVLLERGTRLSGETRGQVAQGMARVFVLWTEARTPQGVVVPLDSPGADELGRSGLPGTVNRHFWDRFGAAMLVSLLDGGVQAGVQSQSRGGTVIYDPSAAQGVLTESLKGTLDIPPTVRKPNGDRIQVLVARDLDFRPVYELRTRD